MPPSPAMSLPPISASSRLRVSCNGREYAKRNRMDVR
jgi:hypothetical protein